MHMKGPFYYPPGLVGLGIALHDVLVAILVNELTLDQVQHIFVVTCSWGEFGDICSIDDRNFDPPEFLKSRAEYINRYAWSGDGLILPVDGTMAEILISVSSAHSWEEEPSRPDDTTPDSPPQDRHGDVHTTMEASPVAGSSVTD